MIATQCCIRYVVSDPILHEGFVFCFVSTSEIPTTFTKDLRDVEVPEQDTIILECELSKKGKPVKWLKDGVEIVPGGRIEVVYDRFCHQLIIDDATLEDMGKYSCVCGDVSTSATVTVEGEKGVFVTV